MQYIESIISRSIIVITIYGMNVVIMRTNFYHQTESFADQMIHRFRFDEYSVYICINHAKH